MQTPAASPATRTPFALSKTLKWWAACPGVRYISNARPRPGSSFIWSVATVTLSSGIGSIVPYLRARFPRVLEASFPKHCRSNQMGTSPAVSQNSGITHFLNRCSRSASMIYMNMYEHQACSYKFLASQYWWLKVQRPESRRNGVYFDFCPPSDTWQQHVPRQY